MGAPSLQELEQQQRSLRRSHHGWVGSDVNTATISIQFPPHFSDFPNHSSIFILFPLPSPQKKILPHGIITDRPRP